MQVKAPPQKMKITEVESKSSLNLRWTTWTISGAMKLLTLSLDYMESGWVGKQEGQMLRAPGATKNYFLTRPLYCR